MGRRSSSFATGGVGGISGGEFGSISQYRPKEQCHPTPPLLPSPLVPSVFFFFVVASPFATPALLPLHNIYLKKHQQTGSRRYFASIPKSRSTWA